MQHIPRYVQVAFSLLLLAPPLLSAQPARPLKPELHSGPPDPSSIPNHAVTDVTLPGLHLTGTTLTATGACTLKSFSVVSDTEVRMKLQGDLTIDSKDETCSLTVHHGALAASTYVVVELTGAEQQQKSQKEGDAARAKGEAYMAGLGTVWTLRYADGASEVFTAQPADPGALPDFTSSSGAAAKIMIGNGNNVIIIAGECIRSGTLTGAQVKDGKAVSGNCTHPGAWTAVKK